MHKSTAFVARFIFVSNHLPVRCSKSTDGNTWEFAWDDDALIAQAKVCTVTSQHQSCFDKAHELKADQ